MKIRRLCKSAGWMLLSLLIVGVFAAVLLYSQTEYQLKKYILQKLQGQFPDFVFSIESAKLAETKGVVLHHIRAENKTAKTFCLNIETVEIDCPLTFDKLYNKNIEITGIRIRKPVVNLCENDVQTLRQLFSGRDKTGCVFPIEAEYGIVNYQNAVSEMSLPFTAQFTNGVLTGSITNGNITLPKYKRFFNGINAKLKADDSQLAADATGALYSQGQVPSLVAVSYSNNFQEKNAAFAVNVRGLAVDNSVADLLEPFLSDKTNGLLDRFEFNTLADVHAELHYDGQRWKTKRASLQVNELVFAHIDFPYKAEHLSGAIYVEDNASVNFRFVSPTGAAVKVNVEGHYKNLMTQPSGQTEIVAENVPIDAKLFAALPDNTQQFVQDMRPAGTLNARLLFALQNDIHGSCLTKDFDIYLAGAAVEYSKFPYPLRNIQGLLQYRNGRWTFGNVVSVNGPMVVRCGGALDSSEFRLNARIVNLPMDSQLSNAMIQPHQRQIHDSLHIQGKTDADVQIACRLSDRALDLKFQLVPQTGLTACPDRFPYRFHHITGQFFYDNGIFHCKEMTACNGETSLRTELDFRDNTLTLSNVQVKQLAPDSELRTALPEPLRKVFDTLQMTQPVNITGNLRVSGSSGTQFDITFGLNHNGIQLGFPAADVSGRVRLAGSCTGRFSGGIQLETLTVKSPNTDFPMRNIQGQFFFADNQLHIGVPGNPQIPAKPLTADFFGGKIYTEGLVCVNTQVSYSINSAIYEADLGLLAKHLNPASKKTTGTLNCTDVNIQGVMNQAPYATGKIALRNANIYEAPLMLQMLRELGIRESSPNAGMFNSADIDFKISGNQVNFDQLIFEGNVISLFGSGTMELGSRSLDLMMRSRLGNRRMQIPLISNIVGGVGDQIVQLKVSGSADNPAVARVALPNLR